MTFSHGQIDTFIAKYATDGSYAWSRRLGGPLVEQGLALAADRTGNVLLVGTFKGTVDFGTGALTSAGTKGWSDAFAAKYSPAGTPLWAKAIGGAGDDSGYAVAVDPSGNAVVAGSFQGTVDFGGGAVTAAGQADMFVLNLAP